MEKGKEVKKVKKDTVNEVKEDSVKKEPEKVKEEPKKKGVNLKELLTTVKKNQKRGSGLGHVGYAKKILTRLKREVGSEEYRSVGPGAAFTVVCMAMKKEDPKKYEEVMSKVGKTLYRSEVSQIFYKVRDSKK